MDFSVGLKQSLGYVVDMSLRKIFDVLAISVFAFILGSFVAQIWLESSSENQGFEERRSIVEAASTFRPLQIIPGASGEKIQPLASARVRVEDLESTPLDSEEKIQRKKKPRAQLLVVQLCGEGNQQACELFHDPGASKRDYYPLTCQELDRFCYKAGQVFESQKNFRAAVDSYKKSCLNDHRVIGCNKFFRLEQHSSIVATEEVKSQLTLHCDNANLQSCRALSFYYQNRGDVENFQKYSRMANVMVR